MQTTPWSWYSDPEIFAREQERIFGAAWQYAGHTGEVAEPGSFFTCAAGRVPIVVTRGREGELNAFLNVCRHRGFPVAEGSGRRESLQCAYHAWTYGLDGCLRAAPRSDREPGFDRDALSLRQVAVDTWGPFVFVNPSPDAPPLSDTLLDLPEQIAAGGLDLDAVAFHTRTAWESETNWKIACENFLECYHCQIAHPSFSEMIDVSPGAYALEIGPTFSTQRAALRANGTNAYDPDGEIERGQFHFLWPGLTINIVPGRPNLSIGPIQPLAPRRTGRFLDYFFAPGVDEDWVREMIAFDNQVGVEDKALIEGVQRGVDSGGLEHGVALEVSESLIVDFQQKLAAALG